jgi:Dual-action HEIGH metallo-peptidase
MRQIIKITTFFLVSGLIIVSCKKETKTTPEGIPQDVITKISSLGFSTNNVQKIDEGYLVEGDIILSTANLNEVPTSPTLRIAEVEQYRTFNLVSKPRTITVSTSGSISTGLSNGINAAIDRYNALNLGLTFQRGGSNGGGTINIKLVHTGQYIASSGFPSSTGDPYPEVKYAKLYQNYSLGFVATVIAHEMGHCIGFRHTDYMNRSYSCGSGGNEGQETTGVGAVLIPGTPSGPDPNSWMLSCLSSTTDRPFNSNDKTALSYLYK